MAGVVVAMRLPNSVQETQPWLINEIARDLDLLDVWGLPVQGGRDDFDTFLEMMANLDPTDAGLPTRVLIWLRFRLGDLLDLDDPDKQHRIPGSSETSLAGRVPEPLQGSAGDTALNEVFRVAGLVPLYRTDDEWAGEISNATVHGVLHLAWVEEGSARYRAQLAIYIKERGALGRAYMTLIQPFRHVIVYPALMRQIERAWNPVLFSHRPKRIR